MIFKCQVCLIDVEDNQLCDKHQKEMEEDLKDD